MNPSKISIHNVWQQKSNDLIEEIINFWKSRGAVPSEIDLTRRAEQAVLVVKNEVGEIVGITTAYLTKYPPLRNHFFVLRGMLAPDHRIPGLFIKMTTTTIETLEDFSKTMSENKRPIGVLAEVENNDLKQTRMTQTPSGMVLTGFSQRENPVYVYYFKSARF